MTCLFCIALWEEHQHLAVNLLRSNAAFSSVRHLNPVFWAHWNPWESQPAAWMTWYEVSAYCLERCSHVETLDDVGFNYLKLRMVRQRKYALSLGDLWDGDLFQSIKGTHLAQWRWISSWNFQRADMWTPAAHALVEKGPTVKQNLVWYLTSIDWKKINQFRILGLCIYIHIYISKFLSKRKVLKKTYPRFKTRKTGQQRKNQVLRADGQQLASATRRLLMSILWFFGKLDTVGKNNCDLKKKHLQMFVFGKKNCLKEKKLLHGYLGHCLFFSKLCVCVLNTHTHTHTKLCSQRSFGRCCMLLVMKSCRPLMSWFNIAKGNAMPCLSVAKKKALAAWLVDADGWRKAIASW